VETPVVPRKCIQASIEHNGRTPLVAQFGGIPLRRQKKAVIRGPPAPGPLCQGLPDGRGCAGTAPAFRLWVGPGSAAGSVRMGRAGIVGGMSEDGAGWRFGADGPSIARVYNYWLGGKDNFAADRELAAQIAALAPHWVEACRDNRVFVSRAVNWAARQGIGQFLDLGAGLPTHPAVHEAAREVIAGARVCYVDNDPVVVRHARALLTKPADVDVAEADLSDPGLVLDHPAVACLIDRSEPVCVLLAMVLHFYDPVTARELAAGYASLPAARSPSPAAGTTTRPSSSGSASATPPRPPTTTPRKSSGRSSAPWTWSRPAWRWPADGTTAPRARRGRHPGPPTCSPASESSPNPAGRAVASRSGT
jgi:S-adenosyl methyltransferase